VSTHRRTGTLRFRVTALAALAVLAVLTVVGAGLVVTQRAVLVESLDETLVDRAEAVSTHLRAGQPVDPRDLRSDDVLVQVVGRDGEVLGASPDLAGAVLPEVDDESRVTTVVLPDGQAARLVTGRAGEATVHVAGSLDDVEESIGALLRGLLVAVPLGAAVLAALVWWLVGRVLRPVEAIRAEADRITATDLDRRVPEPDTADEVARLARTMNAMLDRLAGAAERQRRFVADAAHELRSPLARILTQLEVDRAHPGTADPAATGGTVLAEAARLQRLVDDLLLLARGDAGALDVRSVGPVDLDDVVRSATAARDATIDLRGVRPVQVLGEGQQLRRAVDNLVDNAVRHAATRVTVALRQDGDSAVLTVADDGAGVPPEDRERVFERFTRLDSARSTPDGGAGLGLAIARDIAQAHGGTLILAAEGPGARFELRMPVLDGLLAVHHRIGARERA
jgi:signal transduction histidine kinase